MATKKNAAAGKAEKVLGGPVKRTIARSAKTGKLVSKKEAAENPDTTVTETITVKVDKSRLKVPKKLGQAADLLYQVKNERLAAQREMEPLSKFEKELKEHLINTLPKSEANGVAGSVARATIKTKEIPRVADEKKFLAYAKKPGNEDLIKMVPNIEAIEARLEDGKKVPGIEIFKAVTVSLNKL